MGAANSNRPRESLVERLRARLPIPLNRILLRLVMGTLLSQFLVRHVQQVVQQFGDGVAVLEDVINHFPTLLGIVTEGGDAFMDG